MTASDRDTSSGAGRHVPFEVAASGHVRQMTNILMVLSSHEQLGDTDRSTGWYLSEAAHPWKVFTGADHDLTWVSPSGGFAPMDGTDSTDQTTDEFLAEFGDRGPETLTPGQVDAADFGAIFYVGGHGTMWDFPDNEALAALASSIYSSGGVVGAVCHGPAGLLNIDVDGSKLIDGKRVAGFTNAEEAGVELTDVVPFLLEDRLKAAGADHRAGADFEENVVVDGRLVTGQNPPSATGVATAVVAAIRAVEAVDVADVG